MLRKQFKIGLIVFGLILPSKFFAQTLPTGITAVPFYDVTKKGLSFQVDEQPLSGMFEVPGYPEHFLVLGYYGAVYSLYPDTLKKYAPGAIKDYTKKQLADFSRMVRKGIEQGVHSAAFDPNFKENHYFYILYNKYLNESYYNDKGRGGSSGDQFRSVSGWYSLERWILSKDLATLKRDTTIFIAEKGTGHGAGSIVFGKDGYLYMSISSYSKNSWDLTEPMRKILRIDVSKPEKDRLYTIPPSNPFYNESNPKIRKEIFAYGLRNTYRIVANYLTGSILGSEVGQNEWEEINVLKSGKNYGWANGGNGEPLGNGVGVEGPCSQLTDAGSAFSTNMKTGNGQAYINPFSYNGPESENKKITCADFTNGDWSFSHTGTTMGGMKTALPGTSMNCILIGPAFRGDPSSPFYGYHFVSDVKQAYFLAIKEGEESVQNVGRYPNISALDPHNGVTSFAEDSYGNLYITLMHAAGSYPSFFYDIYKLSSPHLKPLSTPRPQVTPLPTTSIGAKFSRPNANKKWQQLFVNEISGKKIKVAAGYSGIEIYDLAGKRLWQGKVSNPNSQEIQIPATLGIGTFGIRWEEK